MVMKKYTKENPLTVFTAFSGYDSQCLALKRLGIPFDLVGWSEIDKNAIQAHNALFPQYKDRNYGDISKIDWSQVPDFDLFTYSSPCFVAGTKVMTKDGEKNIEDVTTKDYVLTHKKNYKQVIECMEKPYNGEMVKLVGMCFDEINCTPEHPFYVREMKRVGHKRKRTYGNPIWKSACELTKNDYLGIPINQESKFPQWDGVVFGNKKIIKNELSKLFYNKKFWYFMGRYVGDGCTYEKTTLIIISCNKNNDDDFKSLKCSIDECGFHYYVREVGSTYQFIISNKELCVFVQRYGKYAHGKRIDGETISLPKDYLKCFVDGYVDSNGSYIEKNDTFKTSSVSKELSYGIAQCVAKSYEIPYKIYYQKRKNDTCVIDGRTVNQKPCWQVVWFNHKNKYQHSFYENGYIWFPVKDVSIYKDTQIVYNLEVEDDHSYTANGVSCHNCQDFSNAGKQSGGMEGSGTRSSLLWECRKTILAKKPKYLLFENVKALVTAKFLPLFEKWCKELEDYGYANFYQVLNSKDYGVPQSRDRIFMISILKTEDEPNPYYEFPKPIKLEKTVEDLLEDKIPEKYYMKPEVVDRYMEIMSDEYSKTESTENGLW